MSKARASLNPKPINSVRKKRPDNGARSKAALALPGLLQEIADANWLAKVVGLDKARAIGAALCSSMGVTLLVPKGPALAEARRLRIETMIQDGRSEARVAEALGPHAEPCSCTETACANWE